MQKISYKKELIKIGLGLGYVILIISIISYFHLNRWGVILLLCTTSYIWMVIGMFRTKKFSLKSYLVGCIWITGLVWLLAWLEIYTGKWSFLITTALITGLILFRRRKQWFELKHRIETMVWGKPLYEYRKAHQKPPSIQIVTKK